MVFAVHWYESAMGLHVFPILIPTLGFEPFNQALSIRIRDDCVVEVVADRHKAVIAHHN